jgi:hypothetical protein
MVRRTKAQWRELIEQQHSSGLIAAEFCRQHSVNAKYFSLQKRRLTDDKAVFVKVMPSAKKSPPSSSRVKLRVIEFVVPLESVGDVVASLLSSS